MKLITPTYILLVGESHRRHIEFMLTWVSLQIHGDQEEVRSF